MTIKNAKITIEITRLPDIELDKIARYNYVNSRAAQIASIKLKANLISRSDLELFRYEGEYRATF